MEHLNEIYLFLSQREFSVPLLEMCLFVSFISICLLFGRYRMGLLITYCFVFYWGFIFNIKDFITMLGETTSGMQIYIFAGIAMFFIAIISFFIHAKE